MLCQASSFRRVEKFNKYLGSFIDGETRSRKIFDDIHESLQKKLASWKPKLLSQASRVVLIKSVLSSIPVYHLSYFALSEKEAKKCDSIIANFFWGNHQNPKTPHMLAWTKICQPKQNGGLGIRAFGDFNKALLGRQAWRIISNRDSLLSRVFMAKYCYDRDNLKFRTTSQASTFARAICNRIEEVVKDCHWRVGNGKEQCS